MFHEMDLKTKKKFLIFLTGSDRIPIHGIHSIKIIIQKVKDNTRSAKFSSETSFRERD